MQAVGGVRWSPGAHYEMEEVKYCRSLTVTAVGEVVLLVETQKDEFQVHWYNRRGKLLHTALRPPQCGHTLLGVLAVEVGGKQQVALSCWCCRCIWLGSWGTGGWSVAWEPTGAKEREREGPGVMCQGKPGQIIAVSGHAGDSVSVFDTTQIPFCLVVPELKLGMKAYNLCYCDLAGVGGALAVTDGFSGYKLSMFRLIGGELLWSVGDKDENGKRVKVAGCEWHPAGVCTDNRGRLFVADKKRRIIVFTAASGSVLQVVQGRSHWDPVKETWVADPGVTVYGTDIRYKEDEPEKGVASGRMLQEFQHPPLGLSDYLCWHEQSQSIIVGTWKGGEICSFQITCTA